MENKAKGTFISFLFGLLIGYWPLRWIAAIGTFILGYMIGDSYHLITTTLEKLSTR